jgi:hypothetical protein
VDDLARPSLDLLRGLKGRAASRFIRVVPPFAVDPSVERRLHGEPEEVPTPELPGLPLAAPCRALRAPVYRTPPRYSMVLPGVLYEPSQNVLATRGFEPIEQPNQVPRRLHHYRWRPWLLDRRRVVRLAGTFTSLRSFRDNYFHTLVDNVPALDLLREAPYRDWERIELVHGGPLSPAEEFLLARTLPANVVPRRLEPGRFYELERYVFTSFLSQRYSGYLPSASVAALVERCAGGDSGRPPVAASPRRIFVSRALARNGYRHIVNEGEVMALLARRGFERVCLERLDPAGQIALFGAATCVVAAHGAGLANLLFARAADVVELFPEPCVWPHFYLLSRSGRHRYHHLCGDRPARNDRFRVDVAALERILHRIESAAAAGAATAE